MAAFLRDPVPPHVAQDSFALQGVLHADCALHSRHVAEHGGSVGLIAGVRMSPALRLRLAQRPLRLRAPIDPRPLVSLRQAHQCMHRQRHGRLEARLPDLGVGHLPADRLHQEGISGMKPHGELDISQRSARHLGHFLRAGLASAGGLLVRPLASRIPGAGSQFRDPPQPRSSQTSWMGNGREQGAKGVRRKVGGYPETARKELLGDLHNVEHGPARDAAPGNPSGPSS